MEPDEYRRMFELEDRLWWYGGLRLHLAAAIRRAALPATARALDAGCGTGANLALLAESFDRVVGVDLSPHAVAFARTRGAKRVLVGDVNGLPFAPHAFDLVLVSDVFECAEVDEPRAVAELARVTRPGGRLIVAVAAYQFLLSEHDRAVHSVRRYTKTRARRAFAHPDLRVAGLRYCFGPLFPSIAAYRLLRRRPRPTGPPRSDLAMPPGWLNGLLLGVVRLEARAFARTPLPFGTTLVAELERV